MRLLDGKVFCNKGKRLMLMGSEPQRSLFSGKLPSTFMSTKIIITIIDKTYLDFFVFFTKQLLVKSILCHVILPLSHSSNFLFAFIQYVNSDSFVKQNKLNTNI